MRVGVIGRGFGARVVAPAFGETDGCDVVDIVSPRDQEAVAGLCARSDLDLISVHSPPFMHHDHVRLAIEGGHAVLCDKPFGRNSSEAAAMCELATEAGIVNLVNFEMRFDPLRERLRALIVGGAVGTPEHVHVTSFLSLSRAPLRKYGWLFDADLGGGWIGAWGSHLVDFLRWSFGDVSEASAQLRTAVRERPDASGQMQACTADDGFAATLATSTGVSVAIDSSFAAPIGLPSQFVVMGSEAIVEVVGDKRITRLDGTGSLEDLYDADGSGDLKGPMRAWTSVVRDAVESGQIPGNAPAFSDGYACRQVLDLLLD